MRGRIESLIAALVCAGIALAALLLWGCGPTWQEVLPPAGVYPLYTTITVQEAWCDFKGEEETGLIRYNTVVRSVSTICVSLKSDDVGRTINHEMEHAWKNAMGLDAKGMHE